MKNIAVFTSGGDAPGMNACIRAVTLTALNKGVGVYGILNGYEGMIEGDFIPLTKESVSGLVHQGGTILYSSRSERFRTKEGRQQAYKNLKDKNIDGIVAIGGNGTFTGAEIFFDEFQMPTVGAPGTIDNDLYGTDFTIGFDTACNTIVDAVDKIRDTAASHHRVFFVEVMGRNSGYLALNAFAGSDSEAVLIPERADDFDAMMQLFAREKVNKKSCYIVIVAEGDDAGDAFEIQKKVLAKFPHFDSRVSILGHMQRGGNPSCLDRINASRMGMAAAEGLLAGKTNVMAGIIDKKIVYTPFKDCIEKAKPFNEDLMQLASMLTID